MLHLSLMNKFTNERGDNVFGLAYALLANERMKVIQNKRRVYAEASTIAKQLLEPRITFDGSSATAYVVYSE